MTVARFLWGVWLLDVVVFGWMIRQLVREDPLVGGIAAGAFGVAMTFCAWLFAESIGWPHE